MHPPLSNIKHFTQPYLCLFVVSSSLLHRIRKKVSFLKRQTHETGNAKESENLFIAGREMNFRRSFEMIYPTRVETLISINFVIGIGQKKLESLLI